MGRIDGLTILNAMPFGKAANKKGEGIMKKFLICLMMVSVVALSLSADVYVKMKTHTDAMSIAGQNTPAKDAINEEWIGNDKFAIVSEDQSSYILDLKTNTGYIVNHKNKSYVETPLPLDLAKLLPPEAAAFAGMMKMTATVNPTNETKKIGQWNCTGYDETISLAMGMTMKMKIWASTDVGFDWAAFNSKMFMNFIKGQMMIDDASVKEMMKVKGFQISSETSGEFMGAKMRTTYDVVEISKKDAPANLYAVPAGYAKKATLDMSEVRR
jgi:hypothetical protein